jgi:hypothetical protein
VTPQGTRDADPTSSRRSGVDETPQQPSRASSTPASDTTPRHRPEIGAKALITDTRTNYQRRYGRLPASLAPSRTLSRDTITPTPSTTPTIPSDDESTELPRINMHAQLPRMGALAADQPTSSSSESYAIVSQAYTPENPVYSPDPRLFNVRKITESLKAPRGRGRTLFEALRLTFNEAEQDEIFPSQRVEVRDNKGVKRFKFHPDYAEHLVAVMELVSDILNEYLQAAGKSRTFSFGRSALYDMEFTDLIY